MKFFSKLRYNFRYHFRFMVWYVFILITYTTSMPLSLSRTLSQTSSFLIILLSHITSHHCILSLLFFSFGTHLFVHTLLYTGLWGKASSREFAYRVSSSSNSNNYKTHVSPAQRLRTHSHINSRFYYSKYPCANLGREKLNIGKIEIVSHDKIKWKLWKTFFSVLLFFCYIYYIWLYTVLLVGRAHYWVVHTNPMQKFFCGERKQKRKKTDKQNLSKKSAWSES